MSSTLGAGLTMALSMKRFFPGLYKFRDLEHQASRTGLILTAYHTLGLHEGLANDCH